MSDANISIDALRTIPLFGGLDDTSLGALAALFEPVTGSGVVFEAGQPADALYVLASGTVELTGGDGTLSLSGPAVIGELGALGGLDRLNSATAAADASLWKMPAGAARAFFEENPGVGLRLQRNLIAIAADKVERDQRRISDMRANIIRTQKAMKRVRDFLLESEDTKISDFVHDEIDSQIRRNRRVNYRVTPPPALASSVKTDDGRIAPVLEISRTHLSYRLDDGALPGAGDRTSGVLDLHGLEIPVSGKVLRTSDRRVDLELDLLLDEYAAGLEGYLTRLQMLDVLV